MSGLAAGMTLRLAAVVAVLLVAGGRSASAQTAPENILRIALVAGRSYPLTTPDPITKIAVANPDIADVVVVAERDLVINGKANGETDIVLWAGDRPRLHYRVSVRAASDRRMVLLAVRLAEVRRDLLRNLGVSGLYRESNGNNRVGAGQFKSDNVFDNTGKIAIPAESRFLTILSDFGTQQFLGFLEAEEQGGRARLLAEPNLLTADRDSASFLAGGEFPVPIVQGGAGGGVGGQVPVTIQFREFGIRLSFRPEILSDSIIKLHVNPEVSSLDYSNAVLLGGFRIPALRTRRVSSTVDIRRDQSVILSGLFNEEREKVRNGIPLLMNIPIIGALFGSTRWQNSESELLVVVTPRIIDPSHVDGQLVLPIKPDTTLPAREAIQKRLPAPPATKKP